MTARRAELVLLAVDLAAVLLVLLVLAALWHGGIL